MKFRNPLLALAAIAATSAGPAFAAGSSGLDYSPVTGAVDAQTIASGILLIGGIMIVPRLARMGSRWLKGEVK